VIVARLLAPDAPIALAIDDTLIRRRGRKVADTVWTHDACQPGKVFARGNRWVIAGIVVQLPFCSRPVTLPVLFRLWRGKGTPAARNWPAPWPG
jgi:hypothetical protein